MKEEKVNMEKEWNDGRKNETKKDQEKERQESNENRKMDRQSF